MMLLNDAYEKAMVEINVRSAEIQEEYLHTGGGMMSAATAKEMAEKQWLYGNLMALKTRRKIEKPKETKGANDDK